MRKFSHTLKRIFSDKGLLLTLVLSLMLMLFFYGKLLRHPCTTYFGLQGDGMQIYYETLYHIKFDTHYWTQNSINYPYGESIFFTGAMPFINNIVKIFGPSAAPLGVGLINLLMLFSPVIGALFIYAIFRHLRLPWHYGGVCATAIAFLSPQMARMYGHYSLEWVFLIPAMFYFLLRFYDYPSLKKSFLIGFLVFLGASTHLYFLAFFAAIGGAFWAILFLTRDRGFGRISFVLKHAGIQFILPVIILQILVMMSDHVTDRTIAPWGYLIYHSNLAGVYFPFGKPYEKIARTFIDPDQVEFEGVAYVGLAAIIGLITITIIQLLRLFRGRIKLLLAVTDNKVLNIFFWTSLATLWVSFGHPFIGKHEDWLPYIGPFRQFRAIGRFTWIFFYAINIITVYRLYKIVQQRKIISYVIMVLIGFLLSFDMYYNNRGMEEMLDNRNLVLEDEKNNLPEDVWLKNFNPNAYQAILALPYFHIGSENVSRAPADGDIVKWSYIVSLKTGLPMMDVCSGRVSIGQTLKLVSLVLDPLHPFTVLKDLPDQRPLLVLVRDQTLDENEKRIVRFSKPIAETENYKLYSLDISKFATIPAAELDWEKIGYTSRKKYFINGFESTDSSATIVFHSFDNLPGKVWSGSAAIYNMLFDSTLSKPGNYLTSFHFKNIDKDIFPRATIEIFANDGVKGVQPYYFLTDAFRVLKGMNGTWGILEIPITTTTPNAHVQIKIWNFDLKKSDKLIIDNFLIRPENADIYKISGDTIWKNNRSWYPQQ